MAELAGFIDTAVTSVFGADAFVTGVVLQLDTDSGVLRCINAGHPAPLLRRTLPGAANPATDCVVQLRDAIAAGWEPQPPT